jgi:hypothetical protein
LFDVTRKDGTRASPLDAGTAAPLTADDLVPLLEGAFSFAVLALLLLVVGFLLHFFIL